MGSLIKSFKIFESEEINKIKDLIEDLFTQVIDEFKIKEIPRSRVASSFMTDVDDDSVYYHIDGSKIISFRIYQNFGLDTEHFDKIVKESIKVIERIKRFNLGYNITFDKSIIQNPYNFSRLNIFLLHLIYSPLQETKILESFNSNNYYLMSDDEWEEFCSVDDDSEKFTTHEYKIVSDLFKKYNIRITIRSSKKYFWSQIQYVFYSEKSQEIYIYKCKDSYYYVQLYLSDSDEYNPSVSYKCDQFDGLMKCLTDKLPSFFN